MTKLTLRLVAALLVTPALFALACGGKSDGDDEGPTFLEEPRFQQLFPSQLCALISSCCNRVSAPIDEEICRTQATEAVDELSQDGVVYDGAAAAACFNGYASAFARCTAPSSSALDACDVVYVGNVPPGGACVTDAECAGRESYCEPNVSGALFCVDYSFTVLPAEAGVEGEACAGSCTGEPSTGEPCLTVGTPAGVPAAKVCYQSDGLYCDFSTQLCAASPGLGQPCDNYCAPGAYCDFNVAQCMPTLADGQPCGSDDQCSSRACGGGVCGATEMLGAAFCDEF